MEETLEERSEKREVPYIERLAEKCYNRFKEYISTFEELAKKIYIPRYKNKMAETKEKNLEVHLYQSGLRMHLYPTLEPYMIQEKPRTK